MRSGTTKRITDSLLLLALTFGTASAVTTQPAFAQAAGVDTSAPIAIRNQADLIQWMTYYYLHPQPDLLVPALTFADSKGLVDAGQAPLTAFVSRVFAQNPERIPGWVDRLSGLSPHSKPIVWSALWWSNTTQGKEQLNKLLVTLPPKQQEEVMAQMGKPAEPIEKMEMNRPEVLDELWGAWSATGDEKYVDRLMTALPWLTEPGSDFNKLTIGGAARWSLASNAVQHPRVLKICIKARDQQPQLKKVLDQIIADAQKTSGTQQASTRPPQ